MGKIGSSRNRMMNQNLVLSDLTTTSDESEAEMGILTTESINSNEQCEEDFDIATTAMHWNALQKVTTSLSIKTTIGASGTSIKIYFM